MDDRLTKKGFNFTSDFIKRDIDSWSIAQCLNKLQKYEDLEEQGLLIKNSQELKESILERMQQFVNGYSDYSGKLNYFGGKVESMETAMHIVKAAFCEVEDSCMNKLSKLSNKIESYIQAYKQQPTGKEVEGTVELLEEVLNEIHQYDKLQENGLMINVPCKVGDTVWVIDDDNQVSGKKKVYEAKWSRIVLVQTNNGSSFELHGEVRYMVHDFFYNDGRLMPNLMYVGQEHTKVGEVVFFTREDAEEALNKFYGKETLYE